MPDDVVIPEDNFNRAVVTIEVFINFLSEEGRLKQDEYNELTEAIRLLQCKTVMLSTLIPYALNELRKEM